MEPGSRCICHGQEWEWHFTLRHTAMWMIRRQQENTKTLLFNLQIRSDVTALSQRGCPQISKPFNSVLLDKQDFDVSFLNSRSLVARKDKRRSKEGGAGADDHIGLDNFIHFKPLVAASLAKL